MERLNNFWTMFNVTAPTALLKVSDLSEYPLMPVIEWVLAIRYPLYQLYDHLSFSSLSFLLTLMNATISRNTTARTATCSVVEEISEEVSSLSSLLSGFVVPPLLLPVLPVLPDAPTSTVNSMVDELELPDASALTTDNV